MIRTLSTTMAGVALGAAVTVSAVAAGATTGATSPDLAPRTQWMRTACPAEDSLDCQWNAHTRGNGVGVSFYAVKVKLLGVKGHRIGVVGCHYLVNTPRRPHVSRYDSCQILHRGS